VRTSHRSPRAALAVTTAAVGILLAGLPASPAPGADVKRQPVPQAWRDRHEPAILAAAIGRQLAAHAAQTAIACYCVAVQRTLRSTAEPPAAALLARFKRHRPAVRPPAACRLDGPDVVSAATSRPALSIVVGPVYWNTTDRVSVDIAWRRDGKSGATESATFVRDRQEWTFVASAVLTVS
jgi:hypothetical protein